METRPTSWLNRTRTHLSVDKDAPDTRPVQLPATGTVIQIAEVGGSIIVMNGEQPDHIQWKRAPIRFWPRTG